MTQETVIHSQALVKNFRSAASLRMLARGKLFGPRIEALKGFDLRVGRGEIIALLGPNGAGKSTLLRLISALLLPDAGQLTVLGQDIRQASASLRREVCYVGGEERSFSQRLTAWQNLEFYAALHGLNRRAARPRIERALEIVGLKDDAQRQVREYSTGMKQRLMLARGLLGQPQIYLFDEPTRGVDPAAAAKLRRLMRDEIVGPTRTAIVATHDLTEVSEISSRVIVLDKGQLMSDGSPEEAARLLGVEKANAAPVKEAASCS